MLLIHVGQNYREAEAAKKAEAARKKAEKDALLAEEEKSLPSRSAPKNAKTAPKKTRGLDLSQLDNDAGSGGSSKKPGLVATNIDDALDALGLDDGPSGTKVDRHPERRRKAAYAAFDRPTLEVIGPLIEMHMDQKSKPVDDAITLDDKSSPPLNMEATQAREDNMSELAYPDGEASGPKRRMLGPEMPSAELLAAAAKLTEAQTELREVELEEDDELFVGPPPPAMVAEAETANEAERFEEVSRIMDVEGDSPYDILGLNRNLSIENIKKRYWKMSLLVHPDKCSHPHANQAFIRLNNAFKELQDPDKRKALDDKIKFKEEQEQFKVELRGMREAAKWRKSQGISMEGDEELLANMDDEVTAEPKRDEWMTNLPPERKPGMTMQSSRFSKSSKESRGDTSVWTDTPSDRAQKAKMSYLEAYNEAAALASNEEAKKYSAESALVDKYNQEKRSKSLVEKHREGVKSRGKKKLKQVVEKEDEWVGKHPWKPWDREKDLTAGRKSINFDPENMAQGLGSRFSSGSYQRNFL